jgi:hypothetical protein
VARLPCTNLRATALVKLVYFLSDTHIGDLVETVRHKDRIIAPETLTGMFRPLSFLNPINLGYVALLQSGAAEVSFTVWV